IYRSSYIQQFTFILLITVFVVSVLAMKFRNRLYNLFCNHNPIIRIKTMDNPSDPIKLQHLAKASAPQFYRMLSVDAQA
ncbi:hypothetical protein ILUMI_17338, partial [Ignelater luminosus]